MTKYSDWSTITNQGNIVGARLSNEVAARWSGAMVALSFPDQRDASLAELLAAGAEVFNVKSFGATGNGTTNDTQNFKEASDAAAGATVFVPEGTYIIQTWNITGDDTQVILAPGATLKLPDSHTDSDASNRAIAIVSGEDCYWEGGLLDGNYPNALDQTFTERWVGIKCTADGFTARNVRGFQLSRHVILIEGGVGTPVNNCYVDRIRGNDCLRDVISWSRVHNCVATRIEAITCGSALQFSDGVTNCTVRDIYAESCTVAAFQSIIHNGNLTEPNTDNLIDGVQCQDCSRLFFHQSGESLVNTRWVFRNMGGTGWTVTANEPLAVGFPDTIIENLKMEDFTPNKSFLLISGDNVTLLNCQAAESNPGRSVVTVKNSDNVKIIGGRYNAGAQPVFRVEVSDGGAHSNMTIIGADFSFDSNEDLFNILETSGTISNIQVIGCTGLGASNTPAASQVVYRANSGGVLDGDTTFGALVERIPQGTSVRQKLIDTDQITIADNAATTLFTFTVPLQNTAGNGVGATFEGTLVFHTNKSAGNNMTSIVKINFCIVRNINQNTVLGAIQFATAVATINQGTDGDHTAIVTGQLALAIDSGASTAAQVISLKFTNNFDPGVATAVARFAGMMTSVTGGNTSLPPFF